MPSNDPKSCLPVALAYAARGWPVFPIDGRKHPLTSSGFKDATTDADQIRAWWNRWPTAGIGIPTGAASGLVALDLDRKHGDPESMLDALAQVVGDDCPAGAVSVTGGGGLHVLFAAGDTLIRCSAGKIAPGVDVRGDGGYIAVPPSPHASGRAYAWQEEADDGGPELAPAPLAWLITLLGRRHPASLLPAGAIATGTSAGGRDVQPLSDAPWIPDALKHIAADCSYGDWIAVGMALEQVEGGLELFDQWSATAPERYEGPDAIRRVWRGIEGKVRSVTLGSLWHRAVQGGWRPPIRVAVPPPTDDDAPAWLTGGSGRGRRAVQAVSGHSARVNHSGAGYAPTDDAHADGFDGEFDDDAAPPLPDDLPPPDAPWSVHAQSVTAWLDSMPTAEHVIQAIESGHIAKALGALAQTAPARFEALSLRVSMDLPGTQARALMREAKRHAREMAGPRKRPAPVLTLGESSEPGCGALFAPYQVRLMNGVSWLCRVDHKVRDGQDFEIVTQVCSPPIEVTGRVINVTDKYEAVRVEWKDGTEPRELVIPRGDAMTSRSICAHFSHGLPGSSNTAMEMTRYISEAVARSTAPAVRQSRVCGWHGGAFVRGAMTHGSGPGYNPPHGSASRVQHVVESGLLADWSAAMRGPLEAYPVLRVCVAAAVASPVLAMLGPTARQFFVDLCGDTGTGKTQMMEIALSAIGNGQELHTSFADTAVGLERHVEAFHDITVGIDETKRWTGKQEHLARLVYDLAGHGGKGRGAPSPGRLQSSAQYRSIVIATSEHPLSGITGDAGLRSRCLTIQGAPWGERSTARAIEIHALLGTFQRHHGWPLRVVVDALINLTDEAKLDLRTRWEEFRAYYCSAADRTHPHVEVRTRLSEYAATLSVAGELLAYTTGCASSDLQWVDLALWGRILDAGATADRAQAAIDLLCAQPVSDPARWWNPSAPTAEAPPIGWVGTVTTAQDPGGTGKVITGIAILPDRLQELLTKRGFTFDAVIASWATRGWLATDDRHRTRTARVGDGRTRCFVLSAAGVIAGSGGARSARASAGLDSSRDRDAEPADAAGWGY